MLPQTTLETDRLILSPLTEQDIPAIQQVGNDFAIADTLISLPHPFLEKDAIDYVSTRLQEFESGHAVSFAIRIKPEESCRGIIEIREIDRHHSQAEISYWIAKELWGKGYMSEAILPILKFGFATLGLNRLYAYHMVRNLASGKVLQNAGFVQEGVLRQRTRKWDKFEDVKLWAMLHEDW